MGAVSVITQRRSCFWMRLSLRRILIFSCTITALIVAVVLAPRCPSSTLARLTALVSQVNSSSKSFIKPAGLGIRPLSTSTTHKTINLLSRNQTMAYEKELKIAQLAVARAAILTKAVFHEKAKGTVSKDDKSPVTIGDFGAQALIIAAIKHNFPSDEVVGEEEASSLREEKELSSKISSFPIPKMMPCSEDPLSLKTKCSMP